MGAFNNDTTLGVYTYCFTTMKNDNLVALGQTRDKLFQLRNESLLGVDYMRNKDEAFELHINDKMSF